MPSNEVVPPQRKGLGKLLPPDRTARKKRDQSSRGGNKASASTGAPTPAPPKGSKGIEAAQQEVPVERVVLDKSGRGPHSLSSALGDGQEAYGDNDRNSYIQDLRSKVQSGQEAFGAEFYAPRTRKFVGLGDEV